MQGCVLIKKGPDYKFRVSKPGTSVDSTDLNDFIIHEKLETAAPYVTGSAQVPAYSSVYIPFDREYLQPALILLKPENVVAYLKQFEARIQGDMASMRIYNHTGTSRYVTYYVYWNSIGG